MTEDFDTGLANTEPGRMVIILLFKEWGRCLGDPGDDVIALLIVIWASRYFAMKIHLLGAPSRVTKYKDQQNETMSRAQGPVERWRSLPPVLSYTRRIYRRDVVGRITGECLGGPPYAQKLPWSPWNGERS